MDMLLLLVVVLMWTYFIHSDIKFKEKQDELEQRLKDIENQST